MQFKTTKNLKKLEPIEKLARHVIIRAWLDFIGHGVSTSLKPVKVIKQEAYDWINSPSYSYWCDVAGLEKEHIDRLYNKFLKAYDNNVFDKENPHVLLSQLFERI